VVDTTREDVARKSGIYDESKTYKEIPVVLGKTSLLEAVYEALKEMDVGEKRVIEAPPEKAYGEYRSDLVIRVPVKQLRRYNIPARVGQEVDVGGRRGRIVRVTERFAYIDLNHPLAGKKLKIELEVTSKIERDEDKARILASRITGIPPEEIGVESGGGAITVILPSRALGMSDLDARLQVLSRDVYNFLEPRKLRIVIEVEYPERAEGGEGK